LNTISSFNEMIRKHFDFLSTDYNFQLHELPDFSDGFCTVNYESRDLLVRVGKDRTLVFVLLKPSGEPKIAQLSLLSLLEALSVISRKDFPGDVSPQFHDKVLAQYARWLKQQCDTFLKGDLSQWATILARVLENAKGDFLSRTGRALQREAYRELEDYIVELKARK
jgi:hypothetical protein